MARDLSIERRRYRKVSTRIYSDEKFCGLSRPQPNGQSLWLYLITGRHTTSVPGLYMAGEAQLAEDMGWSLAGFRRAWAEIEAAGMGRADWKARVVWLPNAIKHNLPDNPNVVRGWFDALDEIPACALKRAALDRFAVVLGRLGAPFLQPFVERFGKPCTEGVAQGSPIQDQEQEQEQEGTPLPPARGGRITRAERKRAEEVRRLRFGCQHEPRCVSAEACIVATVAELRDQAVPA